MANTAQGPRLLPDTWKNLFYPPEKDEYAYFAHAGRYPFLAADVPEAQRYLVKAAWAADAAMLAYGRYGPTPIPQDEFQGIVAGAGMTQGEFIGDWQPGAKGTQGFFAVDASGQFAILAFRGTERDDLADVWSDAKAWLSDEPEHGAPEAPPAEKLSAIKRLVRGAEEFLFHSCRVHAGFQKALDQVWPQVEKLLNDFHGRHPQAEIVFTGHSLGAALATLAVSRFRGDHASLHTIGSPRVGNRPFSDRVRQQSGGRVFRFTNHQDLVTNVPIEAPFYCHVEEQGYLIHPSGEISRGPEDASMDFKTLANLLQQMWSKGKFLDLDSPAPPALVDHSPARYCMLLRYHLEHHVAPSA